MESILVLYYSSYGHIETMAKAVAEGTEVPVPVADAVAVLAVLDAARVSALEHRTVALA